MTPASQPAPRPAPAVGSALRPSWAPPGRRAGEDRFHRPGEGIPGTHGLPCGPVNLLEMLLGAGAPDAVALVGPTGSLTYRALAARVAALARTLAAAGILPGDRLGLASGNDDAFVLGYLAILRVGAIAVPLNPMAPARELARELEAVEPRLVLAAGPSAEAVTAAGHEVLHLDQATDAAADESGETAPPVARATDDPAVMLFTSGTAGTPKAAVLTHGNLAANITQVLDHPGLAIRADDVVLGALPFHHIFGLNVVLGVTLAAGGAVVLEDHFDASTTAALVATHAITVVAGVPAMYDQWLGLDPPLADTTFASVRLAVSGAAPLPDRVAEGFRSRFGIVLHQGYGLTEAAPIVTSTALTPEPVPGSIGPPLPGVEVRLVGEDGTDALVGDPGEIWVRGPNVFAGYWNDEEASGRALTDDGWLRTGDVAVFTDDQELFIVDRAKDLVIVSGFNVYPAEVEEVLVAHPDVDDAAVVGEEHPRTGEAVVAYLVARTGAALDVGALGEWCADALARYKCPARYEVVDEIPRSPTGKLLRRELRPSATTNPA